MEFFKELMEYLQFNTYIRPIIIIFAITLGMVYLFGRMLNIAKTPIGKNRIAAGTIVITSILQAFHFIWQFIPEGIQVILFYIGVGCILYTLIGMRLFNRVSNLQDKIIGQDGYDSEGNYVGKRNKK